MYEPTQYCKETRQQSEANKRELDQQIFQLQQRIYHLETKLKQLEIELFIEKKTKKTWKSNPKDNSSSSRRRE